MWYGFKKTVLRARKMADEVKCLLYKHENEVWIFSTCIKSQEWRCTPVPVLTGGARRSPETHWPISDRLCFKKLRWTVINDDTTCQSLASICCMQGHIQPLQNKQTITLPVPIVLPVRILSHAQAVLFWLCHFTWPFKTVSQQKM